MLSVLDTYDKYNFKKLRKENVSRKLLIKIYQMFYEFPIRVKKGNKTSQLHVNYGRTEYTIICLCNDLSVYLSLSFKTKRT